MKGQGQNSKPAGSELSHSAPPQQVCVHVEGWGIPPKQKRKCCRWQEGRGRGWFRVKPVSWHCEVRLSLMCFAMRKKVWKWKSLTRVWLFVTHGLYSPWNSPGQNTGVGSLSLLRGIFSTQGWNPGLPHCRRILYQLSHKGSYEVSTNCISLENNRHSSQGSPFLSEHTHISFFTSVPPFKEHNRGSRGQDPFTVTCFMFHFLAACS